jgi:NAD(P)-dependent dehydrogenase (short-subunit alcohol dehydrogenase family)
MARLDGKIALITGGTTGIGAATAKLFRDQGATVIATGRNPDTAAAARKALPGVEIVIADQASLDDSRRLVEQVKAAHGRIDVLFVNAGIAQFARLEQSDEAMFDRMFDVNVRGAYFLIQHAAPVIADGGVIILTGSTAGASGPATMSIYAATKAALRSLGRTLAAELAPRAIRVNTLSPGPVQTPIFGKSGYTPEQVDGFWENVTKRVPLRRAGQVEEVAAAALFLAADATFMTGGELRVGGGLVDI